MDLERYKQVISDAIKGEIEAKQFYKKIGIAMKNEELAMKKYTALAENCDDPQLKKVFLDLASMERDHKFKMENSFVDVAYPEVW